MSASFDNHMSKEEFRSDRFIPNRSGTDFDRAHQAFQSLLTESTSPETRSVPAFPGQKRTPYAAALGRAFDVSPTRSRVLSFRRRRPSKHVSCLHSAPQYSCRTSARPLRLKWTAQSVMALPDLRDDVHTNALDWSRQNIVTVVLDQLIAMWNDNTAKAHNLEVYFNSESCFMTSVATSPDDGKQLVIGSNQGKMMMMDVENFISNWRMAHRVHKRVVDIRWCENVFFSGTDDGHVYLHDPRASESYVTQFRHHSYVVGPLRLSPDNALLACGVREIGEVLIWDIRERRIFEQLSTHRSGNRALAWVPWKRRKLVTGGDARDGLLKLWDVNDRRLLFEHDTKCEITSAVWSSEHEALLTGHGGANDRGNAVLIWKWSHVDPVLEYVSSIRGHQARPLHLAVSPNGNKLASAAVDETLRMWLLSRPKSSHQQCKTSRSRLDMTDMIR